MSDFGYEQQKEIWLEQLTSLGHKYEAGLYTESAFKRNRARIERKLASIDAAITKEKETK